MLRSFEQARFALLAGGSRPKGVVTPCVSTVLSSVNSPGFFTVMYGLPFGPVMRFSSSSPQWEQGVDIGAE